MKKFLLFISHVLVTSRLLGQATDAGYELPKPLPPSGSTPPTVIKPGGSFAPTAYNDARPGMYDVFIWGGHRSYGTLAERNAARWKKEGMTAYVAETSKTYRLNSSMVWVDTNPGSDIIYLKDFGAVGDGVADDTTAVQAAIAAADGRILDIGKGLYSIGPITIGVSCSIIGHHIYGNTGSATPATAAQYSGFIRKAGATGALFTVAAGVVGEMHYIYISGNDVAGGSNDGIVLNESTTGAGYVIDHVVSVDHKASGLATLRSKLQVKSMTVKRSVRGIQSAGGYNSLFEDIDIAGCTSHGFYISAPARYTHLSNINIQQVGGHGIFAQSSQMFVSGGLIGETGNAAIQFGTGAQTVTNILVQDLITRNANCQILPLVPTFTPDAEGTYPAISFTANDYKMSHIQFNRCSLNVAHPDSAIQTTFGNRKVSYVVNYTQTLPTATAQNTYVDCYFASDRAVSGAYPSWVPEQFTFINSTSSGQTDQIHYFGTAATLGNAITVLRGIGTAPTSGSYPVVWDPTTKALAATPTAYGDTFAWRPMPTKRVKYYAYETLPTALIGVTVGTHDWSFSGTGSPTGTQASSPNSPGHPSAIRLSTSTATPSAANWSARSDMFSLEANERYTYNIMFRIPTLSTATDRFIFQAGFSDLTGAQSTDGIEISYTDNEATGNFRLKTTANSVPTYGDATAPAVANTWHGASITATTTAANMSVNGVSFPAVTGTIPAGTSRSFGLVEKIYAGSAITAARSVDIDWFEVIIEDTTQPWVPISNLEFFENMTLPWHDLVAFRVE